jgi:lipopolysaccharide heptosyltransferase II
LASFEKILVVRLSSIGDIILTTPLLRSLREQFPEARITFLIKKQFEELLSVCPYVDHLVAFDSKEGFAGLRSIKKQLRRERFDLYIDIHKNWRSRYLRLGLGAGQITSYNKQIFRRTLLILWKINLYRKIVPVYERYFESVQKFRVQYDGKGTEIHFPVDKTEKVRSVLSSSGFKFDCPLVIICPSATYFNKKWKPEGFVETAQHLIREKSAFIVVHGGKSDTGLCNEIAGRIGNKAISLAGLFSLSESAALLGLASLVIANDSGLMHLAQSQKTAVVGIYGPTTRELGYFPVDDKSTVIETDVYCRPCTHNGLSYCPQKHFRCMNEIPAKRIIDASLHYLT